MDFEVIVKRNIKLGIVIITAMALLSGCGPSKEQLETLDTTYADVESQREEAESAYGKLTDNTLMDQMDALGQEADSIGSASFRTLDKDEADEMITRIASLGSSYDDIISQIEEEASKEAKEADEAALCREITCCIKNESGNDYTSLVFKDTGSGAESENLIPEGEVLSSGETLAVVVLKLQTDSKLWEISAATGSGSVDTYSYTDLLEKEKSELIEISLGGTLEN